MDLWGSESGQEDWKEKFIKKCSPVMYKYIAQKNNNTALFANSIKKNTTTTKKGFRLNYSLQDVGLQVMSL